MDSFTAVDIETTGLDPKLDKIIEIGAVKVKDGEITETFNQLIYPGRMLPDFIKELTGITDEMLAGKPEIKEVLPFFLEFAGEDVILGHHIIFDFSFLKKNAINAGCSFERQGIDTLKIARVFLPGLEKRSLTDLCKYYKIRNQHAHRAKDDAKAAVELYFKLKKEFFKEEEAVRKIFAAQPLRYQAKKESPITAAQIKYLKALAAHHSIVLTEEVECMSKSEASRRIDKILLEYGKIK